MILGILSYLVDQVDPLSVAKLTVSCLYSLVKIVKILYTHSLLERVTLRGCWVSVAVGSQRLAGHGPEQPTIVYPSLNGRAGLNELQRSIPTSVILWPYWLHAYHPSFTCLNKLMTCRPSHSRVFVLPFFKASSGSQKRPWFSKWSLHTLSVLSWNTKQLILQKRIHNHLL